MERHCRRRAVDPAPLLDRVLDDEGITAGLDEAEAMTLLRAVSDRVRSIAAATNAAAAARARWIRCAEKPERLPTRSLPRTQLSGRKCFNASWTNWAGGPIDISRSHGWHAPNPHPDCLAGCSAARSGGPSRRSPVTASTCSCSSPSSPAAGASPGRANTTGLRAALATCCSTACSSRKSRRTDTPTTDTGTVRVYFTRPDQPPDQPGDIAHKPRGVRGRDRTDARRLRFELDNRVITDALVRAVRRGVRVRLVTESNYLDESGVKALQAAGVPVVDDRREGALMHNKFMVFDRKAVWTGSMNFTENCAYRNNNHGIYIEDSRLAENYSTKFAWMFEQRKFGGAPSKTDRIPHPLITLSRRHPDGELLLHARPAGRARYRDAEAGEEVDPLHGVQLHPRRHRPGDARAVRRRRRGARAYSRRRKRPRGTPSTRRMRSAGLAGLSGREPAEHAPQGHRHRRRDRDRRIVQFQRERRQVERREPADHLQPGRRGRIRGRVPAGLQAAREADAR